MLSGKCYIQEKQKELKRVKIECIHTDWLTTISSLFPPNSILPSFRLLFFRFVQHNDTGRGTEDSQK